MRKLFYSSVMLAVILSLTSCSDADSSSQQMSISENSQTTLMILQVAQMLQRLLLSI